MQSCINVNCRWLWTRSGGGAEKTWMTLAFWGETKRTVGAGAVEASGAGKDGREAAGSVVSAFMDAAADAVEEGLQVRGDGADRGVQGMAGGTVGPVMKGLCGAATALADGDGGPACRLAGGAVEGPVR